MNLFLKEKGPLTGVHCPCLCSQTELEASYARCRSLGVLVELVKPQKILPKTRLFPRLASNSLLLTVVEQIIGPDYYADSQNDHIYILCDAELVALKLFATPEVLLAAEETGIKPGTTFTEESCGTNALALAREHNHLVAIRGDQHYCRLFKDWWCVASPIKDPGGKILGYLDISMHAEKELGLSMAHLQTLATLIEREFLLLECYQARNGDGLLPAPTYLLPEIAEKLSTREQEVLHLLLSWLSDEEIARRLFLGSTTVKKHRWNIYQKLGVSNLRELLAKLSR